MKFVILTYPIRKKCMLCGRHYLWGMPQIYCDCAEGGFLYSIIGFQEQEPERKYTKTEKSRRFTFADK